MGPRELRIDGYVECVLGQTAETVEEVIMNPDGSYQCIEEEVAGKEKEPMPDADLVVAGETTHTNAVSAIIPNRIPDLEPMDADVEAHKDNERMPNAALVTIIPDRISDLKPADVDDDESRVEEALMLDSDPVHACAENHAIVVNDATLQKRKEIVSLSPESKRPRHRTQSCNGFTSIPSREREFNWDV